MAKLTKAAAIKQLQNVALLHFGDPEFAHSYADSILLQVVPEEVRAAYQAVVDACDWWA